MMTSKHWMGVGLLVATVALLVDGVLAVGLRGLISPGLRLRAGRA